MKLLRLTISKLQGKICEKCLKMVTRVGIYGPHTQVKCLLKALIFGTYKNNVLISSQIGFELYQSHSLTVTGQQKVQILGLWEAFRDLNLTFKIKASDLKSVTY